MHKPLVRFELHNDIFNQLHESTDTTDHAIKHKHRNQDHDYDSNRHNILDIIWYIQPPKSSLFF